MSNINIICVIYLLKIKYDLIKDQFYFFSDLTVLHQVLSPRIRAFHMCLVGLKDHVDAVYDVTIAYSNTGEKAGGEKIQRVSAPSLTGKLNPNPEGEGAAVGSHV